jgi:hypothetical protein
MTIDISTSRSEKPRDRRTAGTMRVPRARRMSKFFSGFFTIAKLFNQVEAALYIRGLSVVKRAGESSAVVLRSDFLGKILGIAVLRMGYLFGLK